MNCIKDGRRRGRTYQGPLFPAETKPMPQSRAHGSITGSLGAAKIHGTHRQRTGLPAVLLLFPLPFPSVGPVPVHRNRLSSIPHPEPPYHLSCLPCRAATSGMRWRRTRMTSSPGAAGAGRWPSTSCAGCTSCTPAASPTGEHAVPDGFGGPPGSTSSVAAPALLHRMFTQLWRRGLSGSTPAPTLGRHLDAAAHILSASDVALARLQEPQEAAGAARTHDAWAAVSCRWAHGHGHSLLCDALRQSEADGRHIHVV